MALYEHVFIVRQDVGTGQVETLTEQYSSIITEHGGKVEKTEYWGLKSMAYKIKKNRKGHYTLLNVDAPPAALHELERQQRISDDIIRYLTVKVDELEEEPSAMMRTKGRDDRGPRGPRPPFRNDDKKTPATDSPAKTDDADDVKGKAEPADEAKASDDAADTKAPEDAAETQAADDATKPDTAEAKED